MKLDSNFNEVSAQQGGVFVPPPPGGHVLKVVGVSDAPSRAGNDMVTLELDIAEGEHAGAFERYPKKYFQLVNGDNLPYFKGMLDAFEKSNPAKAMKRVINGLDFNHEALEGLLVGGNLREVEYVNSSGDVAVGLEIAYLVPVGDVPNLKTLPIKKLPKATRNTTFNASARSAADDDLPF